VERRKACRGTEGLRSGAGVERQGEGRAEVEGAGGVASHGTHRTVSLRVLLCGRGERGGWLTWREGGLRPAQGRELPGRRPESGPFGPLRLPQAGGTTRQDRTGERTRKDRIWQVR